MHLSLDPQFHTAIFTMANAFERSCKVVDLYEEAPGTFEELIATVATQKRVVAAREGGEHSVFRDASVNAAFMCWHDGVHAKHRLGFNLAGEACCAYVQVIQMCRVLGECNLYGAFVMSRLIGQGVFYARTGYSPEDQFDYLSHDYEQWMPVVEDLQRRMLCEAEAVALACVRYGNGVVA